MKRRTASAILILATGTSLASGSLRPAVAAGGADSAPRAETCHGLAATITGHGHITGTEGPDVIVTDGSAFVESFGGDDTICLGGQVPSNGGYVYVGSDDGDDYVENQLIGNTGTQIYLGDGVNRYVGGPGADYVGSFSDGGQASNTISTFGGEDYVDTGTPGAANYDTVDAGDGRDLIQTHSLDNSHATINAGNGHDELTAYLFDSTGHGDHPSDGAWVFDNKQEIGTLEGTTLISWNSIETFDLSWFGGAEQTFIGNAKNESVGIFGRDGISVDMGGGDDKVQAEFGTQVDGPIRGGTGTDTFIVFEDLDYMKVTASLDSDTVKFRYLPEAEFTPYPEATWAMNGINSLNVQAPTVLLIGDEEPNTLTANGCNVTVQGGAGADRIGGSNGSTGEDFRCYDPLSFALYGEGGDDRLSGNHQRNTLIGGHGRDRADGDGGIDICRAEVERNCELD